MKRKLLAMIMTVFVAGQSFSGVGATNNGYAAQEAAEGEESYGYVSADAEVEAYQTQLSANERSYPSYYSSVDEGYITSVKYQGTDNTCWAFAAVAAAEANAVKQGLAEVDSIDLSELHMAYYFNHIVKDALGNTEGDANENKSGDYRSASGNNQFNTMTLMSGIGFAEEATYPYNGQVEFTDSMAYDNCLRLKNAHWLVSENSTDNISEIKYMVMEYGAVATALYTDTEYRNNESMCYIGDEIENHAVTIVGWDDDYSKENFPSACSPSIDGAWIVKNSWGTGSGKNGYYYVSYEDSNVGKCCIAFDVMATDDAIVDYQYDGSSSLSNILSLKAGGAVGAMYQVSECEEGQMLESVSIALASANTECAIQIYTECDDSINSGYEAYEDPQTAVIQYPGYATIELNNPVYLAPGTTYAIEVKFNTDADVYMDKSETSDWIDFVSHCEVNQTFYHMATTQRWTDLSGKGGKCRVARLKGHAREIGKDPVIPTEEPTSEPTVEPTEEPTSKPTEEPTNEPTEEPTSEPTVQPTTQPTENPAPTVAPEVQLHIQLSISAGGNIAEGVPGVQKITCAMVMKVRSVWQNQRQITISWNAVSKADGYEIYFYDSKKKSYKKVKAVTGNKTKTTIKNLKPGTVYKCKVKAYRNSTEGKVYGKYSKYVSAATAGKAPVLTSVSEMSNGFKVTWQKNQSADGYEVYVKTDSGKYKKETTLKSGKTTSYQYKKAKSGKTYTVKLRAYQTVNGKKVYTGYSKAKKIKL